MGKTGLVVEGGGMKCAYGAGILDLFLDNGIQFDYVIGVSAGSANACSYLAGQRGRNLRFYTTHIHEKGYFGLDSYAKTGDLFGLQYIYGTLTNEGGGDPIDYKAMMENPAELVIVSTDAATGEPCYFRKEDIRPRDYRPIMASCALPGACRPIAYRGGFYYDGGVSDSIPIRKAFADGCSRVVVISSKPRDYVKKREKLRPAYTLLCRQYQETIHALNRRHLQYKECQRAMFDAETEGRAFIFAPSEHLKMGTYTMDEEANQALYDLGVRDFEERRTELMEFLGQN